MIRACALVFLCAGCTDIFALPLSANVEDLGVPSGDDLAGLVDEDMGTITVGGPDGGVITLPASCARLSCTPAVDEGDVELSSGTISGCHAYDTLTVTQTVRATSFQACAKSIQIGGLLDASGGGEAGGMGTGAGGTCALGAGAAGGGHGGAGADPGGCGGGATFGALLMPREPGSGGGGAGGGAGGGVVELAAGSLNLLSIIRANGSDGNGASAGGGSGGSVLIQVDFAFGAGRVEAHGGTGVGLLAGGGGGGRVAIYVTNPAARFDVDVAGGSTMSGGAAGGAGTVKQ